MQTAASKKRTHEEAVHSDDHAPVIIKRICAACSQVKCGSHFSKEKWENGKGRCIECIHKCALQGLVWCQSCKKTMSERAFAKNYSRESPTCMKCVMLSFPRDCNRCGTRKERDRFSERQWKLSSSLLSGNAPMSTVELQELVHHKTEQLCLECEQIFDSGNAEAARQQSLRGKEATINSRRTFNFQFYDFDNPVPALQFSNAKPDDWVGTYDILFHSGYSTDGPCIENRTTRGTVMVEEVPRAVGNESGGGDTEGMLVLSGQVRFLDELRLSELKCFQGDFDFTEEVDEDDDVDIDFWSCSDGAILVQEAARRGIQHDYESVPATIRQVKNRSALPWMKYEQPDENEETDMVQFSTLEEAQVLAQSHANGPNHSKSWLARHCSLPATVTTLVNEFIFWKPNPVFFVEPGDLILATQWQEDRENITTECLLRRAL